MSTGVRRIYKAVPVLALIAIAVLVPYVAGTNPSRLSELYFIVAMVMMGLGLNIVMGYAGQLFLGPTALFSAGGYAAAYLAQEHTWLQGLPAMCVVSVITGLVIATALALPTARISGLYYGLLTLYIAIAVPEMASRVPALGGSSGIDLIADPNFVQSPTGLTLYFIGIAMVVVLCIASWCINRSRLGRRFSAIRQGDELAAAMGVAPASTKLVAFLVGSVPCALAGAFFVYSQQFITPSSVSATLSIYIIAGVIIGGAGTIAGPIIGISLILGFQQLVSGLANYAGIASGVLLIVVAIVAPEGLIGLLRQGVIGMAWAKFTELRATAPTAESETSAAGQSTPEAAMVRLLSDRQEPAAQLAVHGVKRRFGKVVALDGIDLVAEPGRIHAVVGPNGSGKTTLLNLISGYYRCDAGAITLGGDRLDRKSSARIASAGVARTFQTPKLSVYETALANVLLGADHTSRGALLGGVLGTRRSRRDDKAARARAESALEVLGLSAVAETPTGSLPHGTQRLIEIARAIAARPSVVLLDEPAAGLSAAENAVLIAAITNMAAAGLVVIIVEHNLPVVYGVADEITVLHQGLVLAHGTPEQVNQNPEVIEAYLGRSAQKHDRELAAQVVEVVADGEEAPVPAPIHETLAALPPKHALAVSGLSAGYGALQVVEDVSLTVGAGEIVALVGRNGAGKSTTLAAMSGLRYGPGEGRILMAEQDLSRSAPEEIAKAGIKFVPEGRRVFAQMTVEENLRLGAFMWRKSHSEKDLKRVWDVFPALAERKSQVVLSLSGGQQQMVAIGQAIMSRPQILLLDEPTSGLAPSLIDTMYDAFTQLARDGIGILIVDQNIERVLELGSRYYVMDGGGVVLEGPCHSSAIHRVTEIVIGTAHAAAAGS
jgi:branched-chain amino acid transport system ATP-binding protein